MAVTLDQFGRQLGDAARNVVTTNPKAIKARAAITRNVIAATAATRTAKARPGWVRVTYPGPDTALLRLWGGYAKLFELGSYKKPGGYPEKARKVTARRRRSAAAKGVSLNESGLMYTPYGPRASVQHPPVHAKPFWTQGAEAARPAGKAAYQREINTAWRSAFR